MSKILPLVAVVLLAAPVLAGQPAPDPAGANPLIKDWVTPFGVPPFKEIREEHYLPALKEGIARQKKVVEAIVANPEAPSFANTVAALDSSSELLDKVSGVFTNLVSAQTTDGLQAIAQEAAPLVSAARDDIRLDARLFARIKAVWEKRSTLGLDTEQRKLLEDTYRAFVRGGANLDAKGQERLRTINSELAVLGLKFGDNLLKETNAFALVLDKESDLKGLPASVVSAAADAARAKGLVGKWVFTLQAPSIWPFLQYSDNRELRRQILAAYITRGDHGNEHDNKGTLSRIAALRVEKAQLLGFKTWADFTLDENMAKTPARVFTLLNQLWTPALGVARKEAADLQAMIKAEGQDFKLEAWDWRYYTEKVRKARFDLDEEALRPYFQLESVRQGAFYVANRLWGITFVERPDIPTYNNEVKAFEVKNADGSLLGIYLVDYHPRPDKRGGAWMNNFRDQYFKDGKDVRPIIVNVGNFSRPTGDAPALLSLEEVETLFHEFGHALHGLLSTCHYHGTSGTAVAQDFVELPSQIMESWALEPEVLKVYAKHCKTGAVIPDELIAKVSAASRFNQGFISVEYLAACFLDMDWHTLSEAKAQDATLFEKASLTRIGLIPEIVSRYRSPYFNHIFGPGGGYSAGYYSYIWAEVLVADAFQAFKEKGIFDQATARSFRANILERGGSEEAMALYVKFRGREPSVEPLLVKRGLK